MANNLYEEAINAAEQIKEAAENKVKQQLVEAMSPKIKDLIERSLLGEEIDEMSDAAPLDQSDEEEEEKEEEESSKEEEKQDKDKVKESETDECGAMEAEDAVEVDDSINEIEISASSAEILNRMISKKRMKEAASHKLNKISESIKSLRKAIIIAESSNKTRKFSKKFVQAYKTLLSELKNIGNSDIIKSDKTLLREYLKISKELKNMSTRRRSRKNYLNESLEDLLEMNIFEDEDEPEEEEEEGGDDLDLEMEPEDKEGDEEDDDSEEDLDDTDDMPSDDDINWSGSDEELGSLVRDALRGGASDEDEEELDLDVAEEGVDEVYEIDELDEMDVEEEGMPEMHAEARRRGQDLFLEIDENMLKKEITKMRRLREGEASAMASHFGGGKLDKEMFVDVDDGDLNVHAGVLGREDVPMPKVEAALRKTVRKNRMLESKIRQYKDAVQGMKTQLTEMNLFNAKLLYANKLMQNRDLSMKQQRHIVESLDEASTLNEAKLLFESLSKSLSKPSSNRGRNLSEGANRRTLSSASRSTKSAQTLNENVALDRWATLAGIK
jgi:hypothetical protein